MAAKVVEDAGTGADSIVHYSLNMEKVYLHWARFFVRWLGRRGEMRHPRDMGAAEAVGSRSLTVTAARFTGKTLLPLDLKEPFAIH
jgi:hypothetical protein